MTTSKELWLIKSFTDYKVTGLGSDGLICLDGRWVYTKEIMADLSNIKVNYLQPPISPESVSVNTSLKDMAILNFIGNKDLENKSYDVYASIRLTKDQLKELAKQANEVLETLENPNN